MKYSRTLRVSEEIKKIVSALIRDELKDPRLDALISVTRVETTNDLRFANIYISAIGGDLSEIIAGLDSAKGFVRRAIGNQLKLRYTPEPLFKADGSIAESVRMAKLIDAVNKREDDDKTDE